PPLAVEVLEDRTVLAGSVKLSNGTLVITGTASPDTVLVQQISGGKNQPNQVSVTLNGQTSTFKVTLVNQIQAQLGDGDDTITLDNSSLPVTPPSSFDGGSGADTVIVKGTAGADNFTVSGSQVQLTGAGALSYTNFESLSVNGL